MSAKENIKYCREIIEEYSIEMRKLEKQKIEYLEVNKVPPKRIVKRIGECSIIIDYFEDLINNAIKCENEIITSQIRFSINNIGI